ncbi:unnamed protein product [Camellia sinensis]
MLAFRAFYLLRSSRAEEVEVEGKATFLCFVVYSAGQTIVFPLPPSLNIALPISRRTSRFPDFDEYVRLWHRLERR